MSGRNLHLSIYVCDLGQVEKNQDAAQGKNYKIEISWTLDGSGKGNSELYCRDILSSVEEAEVHLDNILSDLKTEIRKENQNEEEDEIY